MSNGVVDAIVCWQGGCFWLRETRYISPASLVYHCPECI